MQRVAVLTAARARGTRGGVPGDRRSWHKPPRASPSRSHRMHLILPATNCDSACEALSAREAHESPGARAFISSRSSRRLPSSKHHTSRLPEGKQVLYLGVLFSQPVGLKSKSVSASMLNTQ